MKKPITLLLFSVTALSLLGCSGNGNNSSEDTKGASSSSTSGKFDISLPDIPDLGEDSVAFHYYRGDGKYSSWDMWIWEKGSDGAAYTWNAKDDFGVVAIYPLSTWKDAISNTLGFLIRKGGNSWTDKDCGGNDIYIDFSEFEKDSKGRYNIYMKSGDSNVYKDSKGSVNGKITYATFATTSKIAVLANLPIYSYDLKKNGVSILKADAPKAIRVEINLPSDQEIDYTSSYSIDLTLKGDIKLSSVVKMTHVFDTESFGESYNYNGELGALYSENKTDFKVWSPMSSSIKLRIYDNGTPASLGGSDAYEEIAMDKGEKGVFSATVTKNLAGKYYTYVVTNGTYKEKEIVDPYAKGCGVNGNRGMIVDFDATNPSGWEESKPSSYDRKELVVYETHVADVTSSDTWTGASDHKKKFLGMCEGGTTYTNGTVSVKTGFDHIKELGVNAIQIIPIFDQANDELNMTFNWGYNPLNYNCLEGGYSSNPKDGYTRIKEFKQLVKAYNDVGINVIMDVVYNHVAGASESNFDVLMPGYYFRYDGQDQLSNGSGCGNETASNHYMMRKFITDSVCFWTKEYKLGGFRFDLMGLHDLETMNQVAAKAKEINPDIVIYGEPWQGGSSTLDDSDSAKQMNGNKYVGYGQFNDQMRDALIRGGLSGDKDLGWVTNQESKIEQSYLSKLTDGVKGITSASSKIEDPDKTVSYVTCHDNYTLYDRVMATGAVAKTDTETAKKMNMLANSVVFTSQGTSFLLAGEEMLRSKQGDKNSYSSSYKVNELDYSLKANNLDLFESYKSLISLKKSLSGLHLDKDGIKNIKVTMDNSGSLLSYDLPDATNNRTYKIVHANGLVKEQAVDLEGYTLYCSTLNKHSEVSKDTKITAFESIVAYKVNS